LKTGADLMKPFDYLEDLDLGILILDADLNLVFANQWVRIRLAPEHRGIRNLRALFPQGDVGPIADHVSDVITRRTTWILSQAFHSWLIPLPDNRFPDGRMRQGCVMRFVTDAESGRPLAMLQIQDVSDALLRIHLLKASRKRLAEQKNELARLNEALREQIRLLTVAEREKQALYAQLLHTQKMESLGTLAGGVAHHFNNALAVILGNADLAEEDMHNPEALREYLSEIQKAGTRMAHLIKQIIRFSHRQTDSLRQTVDIARFFREQIPLIQSILPERITLKDQVCRAPVHALAHPDHLGQVLMNLVANAIEAMRPNGGALTIGLGIRDIDEPDRADPQGLEPGLYAELLVQDTGSGIAPHILPRIFDPFFSTKTPFGAGMGLSVVHGIVADHGGAIRVESHKGGGTAMRVYLPVHRPAS